MDQEIQREYARLRSKQWSAKEALNAAKVNVSFAVFEREGYVRLRVEADDIDLPFLDDRDVFEETAANAARARCSREGVWGFIVEALNPLGAGVWHQIDSTWGFIGDDWKDSGYDTDAKKAAIKWLESFVGEP